MGLSSYGMTVIQELLELWSQGVKECEGQNVSQVTLEAPKVGLSSFGSTVIQELLTYGKTF